MALLKPLLFISQNICFFVAGLFGIGFIIGFHELGHFLFCKLFSIRTPSFSIGFGPKLISKKIGQTEFSLSAIPIGGYVEIAGAAEVGQGEQKDAQAADEHSFMRKPYWQKLLVLLGGIMFNLLFAYTILIAIFMSGLPEATMLYPRNAKSVVAAVEPGSAADLAGIKAGDRIIAMAGYDLATSTSPESQSETMVHAWRWIRNHADEPLTLIVDREGTQKEISYTLGKHSMMGQNVGSAGFVLETEAKPGFSIVESFKQGIQATNAFIRHTAAAIKHLFTKRDFSQAGGPLMIISATVKTAGMGLKMFLLLLALISINLAVLNLIPVPILDGGQLLFYTIEAIVGRPLPMRVREYIHIASWIGFMALILWLTYHDIRTLLDPYLAKIFKG